VVERALVSAVARVSDRMLAGSAAPGAAETAAGAPRGRRARRGRPLARGGWSSGRGGPVWSWKPGVVYRSGSARIGHSVAAAAPRFPAGASKLAMGRRCASLVRMGRGCSGGARWKEMGRMIARVHMHSGGFGGFRAAGLSRGMEHGAAARRSDGDACCETGGTGGACSRCVSLAARSVIARDALLVWRPSSRRLRSRRAAPGVRSLRQAARQRLLGLPGARSLFVEGGCLVRAGCTGARRRRRRLQMKNSRGSSGRLTGMHVEERLPGARGWVPARHACFLTMMPAANENASRGTKHASVPSGARPPLTMRRGDRRAMMRTQAQASHPFCPFGSRSCCA